MRTININTLKNYIEYLIAKDVAGGFLPPDRFNEMAPILVNKMVAKYYGLPEQYQPGQPMPAITYESTQTVIDYISHLKVEFPSQVDAFGKMTLPSDYLHKSSAAVTTISITDDELKKVTADCCHKETVQVKKGGKKKIVKKWHPVTFVAEQERWMWLNNSNREPTRELPIGVFLGNDQVQFYPEDIKAVFFVYIRYPKTPVWGYNIVGGIPVYDQTTSVNIELPEILADEMAVTIMERMGFSIREPFAIDFSRYVKNSGK